jgi:hypothetical protein
MLIVSTALIALAVKVPENVPVAADNDPANVPVAADRVPAKVALPLDALSANVTAPDVLYAARPLALKPTP